jgi:hypothetical protein
MCFIVIGSIFAALGIYGIIGYQEYINNKEYKHVYIPLKEMNNKKKEINNILLKSMNDRLKLIEQFKKDIDPDEYEDKKIN